MVIESLEDLLAMKQTILKLFIHNKIGESYLTVRPRAMTQRRVTLPVRMVDSVPDCVFDWRST